MMYSLREKNLVIVTEKSFRPPKKFHPPVSVMVEGKKVPRIFQGRKRGGQKLLSRQVRLFPCALQVTTNLKASLLYSLDLSFLFILETNQGLTTVSNGVSPQSKNQPSPLQQGGRKPNRAAALLKRRSEQYPREAQASSY